MGMTQGAGIFAQALMHQAEMKRLEQNRGLDALKDAMNSVDVAPDTRQELTNYYVQSLGTPSHKFNAQKFSQGFGDIIGRDHARALDLAQQQSGNLQNPQPLQDLGGFAGAMQLPTTPPQTQAPPGVGQPQPLQPPPALDQLPPMMSSIPQAQLQAPQVQPRPFFDPFRGADVTGRVKAMEAQAMLPTTFQELQGRADIGNQAQMQLGQMRLKALEPYISNIQDPLMQNMMRMEAVTGGNPGNMFAPLMSATFAAPTRIPIDATGMSKEQKAQLGLPENATGKQTILMDRFRNVIGTLPGWEGTAITTGPTGEMGIVNRAAPGVATPLAAPGGQAINPAFLPTTSTAVQTTPGLPPTTTSTTRVKGAPARGASPAQAPQRGGGLPAPTAPPAPAGAARRMPSDAYPAAIQQRAKAVADGSQPMPTDARTAAAVQQYMAEHSLALPTPLSAAGQTAVSHIDPVLQQIQELKGVLEQGNLQSNTQRAYFAPQFTNYRLGGDTPLNEFFTGASFESLRSAAQAMQGQSTRAYAVLQKALVHTPNLWLDSPKNIYEKLNEAEKILQQGRTSILADERKSGVLAPISPPPAVTGGRINVVAPDGTPGTIPADKWPEAEKRGFKKK